MQGVRQEVEESIGPPDQNCLGQQTTPKVVSHRALQPNVHFVLLEGDSGGTVGNGWRRQGWGQEGWCGKGLCGWEAVAAPALGVPSDPSVPERPRRAAESSQPAAALRTNKQAELQRDCDARGSTRAWAPRSASE